MKNVYFLKICAHDMLMSDIKHNVDETDSQNNVESSEISNFDNNSILKVGFIEIKKGSGDWKTFYGIISGGSLFWYKNMTVCTVKFSVHLSFKFS